MTAQYIVVEQGSPHVTIELPRYRPNRLGVLNRFWERIDAFDENSHYRLSVGDVPSYGLLNRVLTRTLWSPKVELNTEWVRCGEYNKAVLVALVSAGLAHDDDIIQQWFGARDVLQLLAAADSCSDMVVAVNCICGAHETNQQARHYVGRVLKNQ